ncbi:MAG: tetratricopeptide repeat protein, partial [Sediminibacterium sp.]
MKFYNLIIKYRFWLSLVLVGVGVILNLTGTGFWPTFPIYFVALIGLLSHFFIGPLRLIQEPMEKGNIEEVEKILNSVWYPNLLYKPIRSTYYTIKGNLAMMNQDFDTAEKHLKKSSDLGAPMPEAEGANKLQLGMMAMQRGDLKQGESYIRAAIRA